jgi:hypothetical protein
VQAVRRPRRATYSITAARGDSWLSARAGSEAGRVLFEGNIGRGETVRLRSRRVWVRFGSASYVDLRINGKLTPLPLFGTYDAYVEPRGVRPDPTVYAVGQATAAQSP